MTQNVGIAITDTRAQTAVHMTNMTNFDKRCGRHHYSERFTLCIRMPVIPGEIEAAVRAAIQVTHIIVEGNSGSCGNN